MWAEGLDWCICWRPSFPAQGVMLFYLFLVFRLLVHVVFFYCWFSFGFLAVFVFPTWSFNSATSVKLWIPNLISAWHQPRWNSGRCRTPYGCDVILILRTVTLTSKWYKMALRKVDIILTCIILILTTLYLLSSWHHTRVGSNIYLIVSQVDIKLISSLLKKTFLMQYCVFVLLLVYWKSRLWLRFELLCNLFLHHADVERWICVMLSSFYLDDIALT